MATKKIVVLISGSGTNLQALIDASVSKDGSLHGIGEIKSVISNRSTAYGLERAKNANISTKVFTLATAKKNGKSREEYDSELANLINSETPDLIVLAGFMHILSPAFLDTIKAPIINLHPALPGEYDGAHAIERAFNAFVEGKTDHTGVMVHWVTKVVDGGKPIIAERINIEKEDTLNTLENRIHSIEHKIIVDATKKVLSELNLTNEII